MIGSSLFRKWRSARQSGRHLTVIEWRDGGLLALRTKPSADGPPQVQDTRYIECRPEEREAAIARLARQGWFSGGRNLMMLGLRQRQLAVLPRPAVPDAELVEAARWQLQGALDYPPEEAVLDVLRLGENEPAARQQLAVFAVRRAELAQWLAPLTARKVTLEAVEVADCAQRNLAALHGAHGQAVAMLGYREDSVVFSVTRGSEVLVSRSFDATSLRATSSAAAAETDVGAFAERVGLQLQRMLDTLERRSASMAPSQIVVIKHPTQAALLAQCAELTGLRVMPLDLTGLPGLAVALAAHPAPLGELQGDFIHLWAAALRPQPVEALA